MSVRWRIAWPYLALIIAIMIGLATYLSAAARRSQIESLATRLEAEARLLAGELAPLLAGEGALAAIDRLAHEQAAALGLRVTIIGLDGVVLGESDRDRLELGSHLFRPEVQQALAEGQGRAIRFSETVGTDMLYSAVAASASGEMVGIVRLAIPLSQVEATVSRLRRDLLAATLIGVLLAGALAIAVADWLARPIRRLTGTAARFAGGDLDARLYSGARGEIGELTRTFNEMADRLRAELTRLADERRRLASVLQHMADGVIIADAEGRVRLMNTAAAQLLDASESAAAGRSVAEVVRHHELIELWQRGRAQGAAESPMVELGPRRAIIRAAISAYPEGGGTGYVMVLQDQSQLRRLENARRDLVSNISHELRTPLAALRAIADTLRDGALDDPPAAERFLGRMETEVEAMTQMVEELLELSRIESGKAPLRLEPTTAAAIIEPVVERLRSPAERAGLQLRADVPAGLPLLLADAERARQALTNLVHNAIKFTPEGGKVTIRAYAPAGDEPAMARIEVRDSGVGVPAGELERIFERFYKADRARSGGGTGLGLAIAKHIVQGHGGRIWATSKEGKGSVLTFTLPIAG
jgi:two-component system phosphate regulon sensor histidine kinase PhoR